MVYPSKYKEEYCQKLIDHMELGLSFHAFAGLISVNPDTLYEWVKKYPEFKMAKEIAFAKCLLFHEVIGNEGMRGQIKNFSASTWIFKMKARFRWKDQQEIKVVDETNKDPRDMTDEELSERFQHAIKVIEVYENGRSKLNSEGNGEEKQEEDEDPKSQSLTP